VLCLLEQKIRVSVCMILSLRRCFCCLIDLGWLCPYDWLTFFSCAVRWPHSLVIMMQDFWMRIHSTMDVWHYRRELNVSTETCSIIYQMHVFWWTRKDAVSKSHAKGDHWSENAPPLSKDACLVLGWCRSLFYFLFNLHNIGINSIV